MTVVNDFQDSKVPDVSYVTSQSQGVFRRL